MVFGYIPQLIVFKIPLITTFGLRQNAHSLEMIDKVVEMDALFKAEIEH